MLRYIIIRLINSIPLLFGITFITFIVVRIAPGSPTLYEGAFDPRVKPESIKKLEKLYGLDKPLPQQYLNWVKRIVKLDFGESFIDGKPVWQKIKERLPITVTINLISLFVVLIVAIPIGVISALKKDTWFDRSTTIMVFVLYSMPSYFLALFLISLFSIKLKLLPISGIESIDKTHSNFIGLILDRAKHLVMPITVLSTGGIAVFSRYMRQKMIEVLQEDYILTAIAKGLNWGHILRKHALRNALMPLVTLLGLSLPGLISGSVIIESIFAIPGIGLLFYESAMARDYPTIMGILTLGAILTLIGNLLADVAYAFIDPRVRYE
ncbi:MAG: ABC transporter permease [Thermosulfidibacteraceae bacterium]|jgi:peptide/nickel transport system permease protein